MSLPTTSAPVRLAIPALAAAILLAAAAIPGCGGSDPEGEAYRAQLAKATPESLADELVIRAASLAVVKAANEKASKEPDPDQDRASMEEEKAKGGRVATDAAGIVKEILDRSSAVEGTTRAELANAIKARVANDNRLNPATRQEVVKALEAEAKN